MGAGDDDGRRHDEPLRTSQLDPDELARLVGKTRPGATGEMEPEDPELGTPTTEMDPSELRAIMEPAIDAARARRRHAELPPIAKPPAPEARMSIITASPVPAPRPVAAPPAFDDRRFIRTELVRPLALDGEPPFAWMRALAIAAIVILAVVGFALAR